MAQENLRLYVEHFGENNVALLTLTMPTLCLSATEFQKSWHSMRTHALKKEFDTGMWIRERQPRTGSWHAHAVVNVGYDIRTGFPFDQVERGFYANVDGRTRRLWKSLREMSEKYGFGRTELLPIKASGPACARYLVKYLGKVRSTDKNEGGEKCRLFGIWGGVRFVSSSFCFLSSRLIYMRKIWFAHEVGASNFSVMFGKNWWNPLKGPLLEVILPDDYYKVPNDGALVWDSLGSRTFSADIARFTGAESIEDARNHSWFRLFWEVGKLLYKDDMGLIRAYALDKISRKEPKLTPIEPQLLFRFSAGQSEED